MTTQAFPHYGSKDSVWFATAIGVLVGKAMPTSSVTLPEKPAPKLATQRLPDASTAMPAGPLISGLLMISVNPCAGVRALRTWMELLLGCDT